MKKSASNQRSLATAPILGQPPSQSGRHKERMQQQKNEIDTRIRNAKEKRGLLLVLTGNGKGKSSSAYGMLARALGHDMRCGVIQFIKGQFVTGEDRFFRRFPENIDYFVMGEGYTWTTQNHDRDVAVAEQAWGKALEMLSNPKMQLLVFDELNIVLDLGYLNVQRVLKDLSSRPKMQHVIVTGRGAPKELVEIADTVSEITAIKHAFDTGIQAQKGIEL